MNKYLCLLRGINVGGNCKVEMPRLKKFFESLGYSDVTTYINSGNVIFSGNTLSLDSEAGKIETELAKYFGFPIKTVLRNRADLFQTAAAIPKGWTNDVDQKTDVLFLWKAFDNKSTIDRIEHNKSVDSLIYTPGAIIWNVKRINYNKSGMNKFIGTEVYKNMTARNANTVRKLAELIE